VRHVERSGLHFRVCDPSWKDPLDTSFAKKRGGRWNPAGSFGVLYLCATIGVAAGNARRVYESEIATLFDLLPEQRPDLQLVTVAQLRVVDAATNEGLRSLRLPVTYPIGASRARCQAIGKRSYEHGEYGIACRSADVTDRTYIVIEGEELVVFDRAVQYVTRLERVPFAQWYPLEVGETPQWVKRPLREPQPQLAPSG
jgi:RES domain-containing protein